MFLSTYDAQLIEKGLGHEGTMSLVKAFDAIEARFADHKTEVKRDLLVELATKADIAELRGATKADIAELRGEMKELRGHMDTELAKIDGRFRRLELILGIIAIVMAASSPVALELIKLLK